MLVGQLDEYRVFCSCFVIFVNTLLDFWFNKSRSSW